MNAFAIAALTLALTALTSLANPAKPQDVRAVWTANGGAIELSWLRPDEPVSVWHIQRKRDGKRDYVVDVAASELRADGGRLIYTDTGVAIDVGEYSYRLRAGRTGPWSRFAVEEGKPIVAEERKRPSVVAPPVSSPPPALPQAPSTPASVTATRAPDGVMLRWATSGDTPLWIEIESTAETVTVARIPAESYRTGSIAEGNVQEFAYLAPPATSYRVRSFNTRGDASVWSATTIPR